MWLKVILLHLQRLLLHDHALHFLWQSHNITYSSFSTAPVSQRWMLCGEWVPSEWESDKNIHLEKTNVWTGVNIYFKSSDIWITSLTHQCLCSEWVPSEWESDKNIHLEKTNVWTGVNIYFKSSDIWIMSLTHQCLCSEWVPSEWESDKNITALQSTHQHLEKTKGETNPALRRFN